MVGANAAIYALAAVGLNLHFGFTGLLNFGQVAFMLVGAYSMAISVETWHLSMWWGIPIGIGAAILLALILGIPTVRLRGDYLAIATIAAGEVLRYLFQSSYAEPVTGGSFGLLGFSGEFYAVSPLPQHDYKLGPFQFSAQELWVMIVAWALVALACLLVFLLMRSPWGRVLRSVREDELAARSLGKNVYSFKLQSLVIGGVIGAIAGALLAVSVQSVQPTSYDPRVTFFLWVIVILGGASRIFGPILGALIFWFVVTFFDSFLRDVFPDVNINVGAVRFALVGLGLMLLMVFRPAGILGNREELRLEVR
jgi:branched-chain amino acid transport system permease protein